MSYLYEMAETMKEKIEIDEFKTSLYCFLKNPSMDHLKKTLVEEDYVSCFL